MDKKRYKLGFDIDGVLANFCAPYERLITQIAGRNTFEPWTADRGPRSWDWPQEHFGYTHEEVGKAWQHIQASPEFWYLLSPLADMGFLSNHYRLLVNNDHEIFFVTSRPGASAKHQTERWLRDHGITVPTVIVSPEKGKVAEVLKLDAYVDDNGPNAMAVCVDTNLRCQSFLIDRAYNETTAQHPVVRVSSLKEMFGRLGLAAVTTVY